MTMTNQPIAWKRHFPMALTWARMAICIPIVAMFFLDNSWAHLAIAIMFILASITDYFDGYFARRFHATSTMGKFMDPIADKILVAAVLIMLIPTGRVGPVVVLLLLSRDILIGGIRSIAAADRVIIDAKAAGKWKTAIQMVSIPAILIDIPVLGMPLR
ncbi:MAG: CDP-diacylglycerol--glycerol-3-phosphate 3-phosphatidyltransferase [Bdellovibrionota bacterium]